MNNYITGATVKRLREAKHLTQVQLANQLGVSAKAVSKWETAKGLPDISLIEPLSRALGVSVLELMSGETVLNRNVSCNLLRSQFYVCPICGNILHATGEAVICCCGITLPPLEVEDMNDAHQINIELVEDERFITVHHPMTKQHYISFFAQVTADRFDLVKLYPEGGAEARFPICGTGFLYLYCNQHGLMRRKL